MTSLPNALLRAVGQLADPPILKVLAKSIALTLVVFAVLGVAGWYALASLIDGYVSGMGAEIGAIVAVVLTIIAGWLLFRLVALAVIQLFADEIVIAVEEKHYPAAAQTARKLPLSEDIGNSLKGLMRAVVANLIAAPFALALLVTGVGTALLFWAVNAWLLGRELRDMAWLRHRHDAGEAAPVGALQRFALGGVIAALFIVPFVNLLAPVIGAAAATHLVHQKRKNPA